METVAFISTEKGDDLILSLQSSTPRIRVGSKVSPFCARRNMNTCWKIGSEASAFRLSGTWKTMRKCWKNSALIGNQP